MDSEWHDMEDGFSGDSDLSTIRARFGTLSDREMDTFGPSAEDSDEDGDDKQPFIARNRRRPWYTSISACTEACRLTIEKWKKKKEFVGRSMNLTGETNPPRAQFVPNVVRNQKYTAWTFLPVVLYEQFRFFFNLYFLCVALTQFIPPLKIGFLFTYIAPLAFVLAVTLIKEAYDDFKRYLRDKEANSQKYTRLSKESGGKGSVPSSALRVGDLVVVGPNERVPVDGVLVRTTEKSGSSFIRTDQLDGETDWKLRRAIQATQTLENDLDLLSMDAEVSVEAPRKEIYSFAGRFVKDGQVESLNLENTMWANCVVASGTCILLVTYTGRETRSVMNASHPKTKVGLLDSELNFLSKLLFLFMLALSVIMITLKGFYGLWYIYLFRFILLFSSIIPISLRVNLDMGKTAASVFLMRDKAIAGTVVRNSGIPEELGRISYLLSDKTGTLTQNDMIFRRLHLGWRSFGSESGGVIENVVRDSMVGGEGSNGGSGNGGMESIRKTHEVDGADDGNGRVGHDEDDDVLVESRSGSISPAMMRSSSQASEMDPQSAHKIVTAIRCLALCHNVTPVEEDGHKEYQSSSPDEVALVKFAEKVGLVLESRTRKSILLRGPGDVTEEYDILSIFPFTSDRKRMGIIVREIRTGVITFLMKGADTIMQKIVQHSEWLSEECDNLAREGLRTLVLAKKEMTVEEYDAWNRKYGHAKALMKDRNIAVEKVIGEIERGMELIGLTGVEDKLQDHVPESLETLRNAGIRVWMLTGDKVDTAICVARAARLVSRSQSIFIAQGADSTVEGVKVVLAQAYEKRNSCLVVDGHVLELCLRECVDEFLRCAAHAGSVVVCRCSPTQKADVVRLLKEKNDRKLVCAIGDGGNDVSMIQAASIGIGIVGKEGKQASLAADVSILQFSYITRLLLWHGRNSYKSSARLSQFVIHRGLIISVIQAVFSTIFYYAAIPIYTGWLMVGYATYYTMLPVFALIADKDVDEETASTYPELYRELQKGRALSYKTFLTWIIKSIYQGGVIMILAIILFEDSFLQIVSISFTALILTELLMVIFEVHQVNRWIVYAECISVSVYFISILLLPSYFDIAFMSTPTFWWKLIVLVSFSCIPVYLAKIIQRRVEPPSYQKLAT